MLTLILKSKDIYKVDSVANRISLALPYEYQLEIDPDALVAAAEKGVTSEHPIPDIYTLPIKFGFDSGVNVTFTINLDDKSTFAQPPSVAVRTGTVQTKNTPHTPARHDHEIKDIDLLGEGRIVRRY